MKDELFEQLIVAIMIAAILAAFIGGTVVEGNRYDPDIRAIQTQRNLLRKQQELMKQYNEAELRLRD
jgi:type II secretory pathway pseudopilin PulG